ncbi:hypothetical protein V8C86DRAFT_2754006 [Haematococcus lacustris]
MSQVWPSDWLAADFPTARLLSLEYRAPLSSWEGESLPVEVTAVALAEALRAAGCGQRPLVFVAHSMGGLLVKEMLARSLHAADQLQASSLPNQASDPVGSAALAASASLVTATRGVLFFATPHQGSGLAALGWKLRHLPGTAPAPCLAQLQPGPHLVALNSVLARLHSRPAPPPSPLPAAGLPGTQPLVEGDTARWQQLGGLRVVSAAEGQPTSLGPLLPAMLIVPRESAHPGFGLQTVLPEHDHVSLCKPASRDALAYRLVAEMLRDVLREARGGSDRSNGNDEQTAN